MEYQLGHQGKFIAEEKFNQNELGGLQENGSYQAWRRAQKPELFDHDAQGNLKEDTGLDNEYVGVRFVNYDENQANEETQKALNVDQMGNHGFLVSGGAYSDPSEYAYHYSLTEAEKKEIKQERQELSQFDHEVNLNPDMENDGWDERY